MALSKAGSFGISLRYNRHARASRRIRKNAIIHMMLVHTVRFLSGAVARTNMLLIRLRRKIFGFLVCVAGLDLKEVRACYGDGVSCEIGKEKLSHYPVSLSYALGNLFNWVAVLFLRAAKSIRSLCPSRVSAIIGTAIVVIIIASQSFFSFGLEVYINKYPIGYIDSAETYEKAAQAAEKIASTQLGRPYTLKFQPEYRLVFVRKDYILEPILLQNILYSNVKELRPMFVLSVDGEIMGALSHREGIDELLSNVLAEAGGEGGRAEFKQDVRIERKTTDITYFSTLENISGKLFSTTGVEESYTVQKGDTVSQIANEYNMTVKELLSLNPSVEGDRIYEGQVLKVSATESVLSIRRTTTVEYTQSIAYKTIEEKSSSMYTYESRVKVSGKNGTQKIVADVIYENGKEVGRVVLSTTVLEPAVDRVVVKGTKKPPATAPTGTFMWPAKGNITSRYGARWGGFHTGIDIANKRGTTIVAADGGTVTYAQYTGGYGNLVKISHGKGVETYYAHNSSFLVKVGDKVAKGQPIALMGSTGRSTGSHCHFEIRINGVTYNPLNYLP